MISPVVVGIDPNVDGIAVSLSIANMYFHVRTSGLYVPCGATTRFKVDLQGREFEIPITVSVAVFVEDGRLCFISNIHYDLRVGEGVVLGIQFVKMHQSLELDAHKNSMRIFDHKEKSLIPRRPLSDPPHASAHIRSSRD